MKRGKILVEPGKPLQFLEEEEIDSELTETVCRIGDALVAYISTGAELLKGRHAQLAAIAPRHLRERGDIFVLRCSDGVFVRYDPRREETGKLRIAETACTLAEVTPSFSERVLYLDTAPQDLQPGDCPYQQFSFWQLDRGMGLKNLTKHPLNKMN